MLNPVHVNYHLSNYVMFKICKVPYKNRYPPDRTIQTQSLVKRCPQRYRLTTPSIGNSKNLISYILLCHTPHPSRTPGSSNACDPFVKIFLLPDERRFVQSKFKRKTTNPKFDESFVFQVSYKALQTRTLRLTVYDVDRHKKHRTLGNVLYPFKDFDYDDGQKIVMWKDLEEKSIMETSDLGEVQFSLTYNNHLERLTVVVLRARGIKKLAGMPAVDTCARVTLMNSNHVLKTKKTNVVTNSSDPLYNESFNFKLSPTQLDTSSLSVAILQVTPGDEGSERQVGRVVVGPFMYARGKELEHWTEMVNNQKDMVKRWHALTQ
ncbi:ABC7-42404400C24.1 [Branchiostoma lanceolatum]|uniref:ABC7-42404400C24.1 protein n=1 Tax=Branchiostoma lanceolatum TaxID=7740 RepID=A0A8K0EC28_BRALA|nr:ABC7-42404400C24.1 [Branchiostoma lanceolatum]